MKKIFTPLLLLVALNVSAQIPNSSFENWTAATGYETPDGWDNLNPATTVASTYTCEKGTTGAPAGSYFLKLTSKTVLTYVAPGLAVAGKIDIAGQKPKSGFAFTGRPQSLTGKWQYMASGADQGYIGIWLTKWNTTSSKRDTVAMKVYTLPGMAMSWANFSINLDYLKDVNPDSAIIGFSASGLTPVAGSYLWVDSVAFAGNVPVNVSNTTPHKYSVQTYPNPVKGNLSVDFGNNIDENLNLQMVDLLGRTVKEAAYTGGQQVYTFNTSDMPSGIYYLKARTGADMQTFKVTVQ